MKTIKVYTRFITIKGKRIYPPSGKKCFVFEVTEDKYLEYMKRKGLKFK